MTSRKRTSTQIDSDRAAIAELYLKQYTQAEIGEQLGIDQSTVSRDLQAIQKAWRESSLMDMNEAKQRELERIDKLEREYWLAWEESKKDAETQTQKAKPIGSGDDAKVAKEITLQKKGQTGNPSYLNGVQWCIEQRAKIIGIYAPNRQEITGKDGKPIQMDLNADTLATLYNQRRSARADQTREDTD